MRTPVLSREGRHSALFYVALFMATGVHLPFWPLWLETWGLTPAEVSLYGALGMGVRVFAGFLIPSLADWLDARRHTIAVVTALAILLFLWHLRIETRPALLAATLGIGALFAGIGPIAEALGAAAARTFGFDYAKARALGSIGFLGANLLVGALMPVLGVGMALWWIVVCLAAVIALAPRHPGGRQVQGQIPPALREIAALIMNPVFAWPCAPVSKAAMRCSIRSARSTGASWGFRRRGSGRSGPRASGSRSCSCTRSAPRSPTG